MPRAIRIADIQLSSPKAQRRAVPGLQQLPLPRKACRPFSSSHDACVREPSHRPIRGKSIRHREHSIDSAHMLCSRPLALSQLTNPPVPPATNQQWMQAALTHTYSLAGPSHTNRAAWWQGQYSPAPFPTPEVILQGNWKHVSGFISRCCFHSSLRLAGKALQEPELLLLHNMRFTHPSQAGWAYLLFRIEPFNHPFSFLLAWTSNQIPTLSRSFRF